MAGKSCARSCGFPWANSEPASRGRARFHHDSGRGPGRHLHRISERASGEGSSGSSFSARPWRAGGRPRISRSRRRKRSARWKWNGPDLLSASLNEVHIFWGAHACSVLVSAFCGDELRRTVGDYMRVRGIARSAQKFARQNAFASTLQACAPRRASCPSIARAAVFAPGLDLLREALFELGAKGDFVGRFLDRLGGSGRQLGFRVGSQFSDRARDRRRN